MKYVVTEIHEEDYNPAHHVGQIIDETSIVRRSYYNDGYHVLQNDTGDRTVAKIELYIGQSEGLPRLDPIPKECPKCNRSLDARGFRVTCGICEVAGSFPDIVKASNPRKEQPIALGFFAYFPNSISEQARISKIGNDQHNPGEQLHWDKSKSTDDLDCAMRHLRDHLKGIIRDDDGGLHLGKAAWRLNAALERFLEAHPEEIR